MCSILGFIDFRNKYPHKKENIYKLNKLMSHRGPDDEGFFNDEIIGPRVLGIPTNAGKKKKP